jgi:hypothetical protein
MSLQPERARQEATRRGDLLGGQDGTGGGRGIQQRAAAGEVEHPAEYDVASGQ